MSPLNVQSVDENLRAIRQIEGAWSLPALPDEVKLDLAGQGALTASATTSFLSGLAADVNQAQRRPVAATRDQELYGQPTSTGYTGMEQVGRLLRGLTGSPAPITIESDAVQRWKRRAVDEGYLNLTPAQIADSRWLPEYSAIAGQMNRDQMKSEFQGEKPGSVSVEQIGNFVEEWLSPRGLFRAAMELDLLPDIEKIARETGTWGERVSDWLREPWNPRKLIDALGPMDDIFFPILNWGLMMSGVGEIWATGRVLGLARKAGSIDNVTAQAVAGLYRGPAGLRFLSATDRVGDVKRFQTQSFLSQALAPRGQAGGALSAGIDRVRQTAPIGWTSDKMAAWRGLSSPVMAKKTNQQVIRLGFAGNLEQLVDREQSGTSIADVTSIDDWVNTRLENPLADWGVDLLFTPPNFFEPGTIRGAAKALGRGVENVTPGFEQVTENQELVMAFHAPTRAFLAENGGDVARFDSEIKEFGLNQALANQLTGGDKEQLGGAMAFMGIAGVLDSYARIEGRLGAAAAELMDTGQRELFHHIRNQAASKLVRLDPGDYEGAIAMMARYGDVDDLSIVTAGFVPRKQTKLQKRLNAIREGYLESEADVVARKGDARSDHLRLYGYRPSHDSEIRWTDKFAEAGDNPYFMDISHAELVRDVGTVDNWAQADLGMYARRYKSARHNDRLTVRGFDPDKIARLDELMTAHNQGRQAFLTNLLNEHLSSKMVEQYVFERMSTLGAWSDFVEATDELKVALRNGHLDRVQLTPALSPSGRKVSMQPQPAFGGDRWTAEMQRLMVHLPDDPELSSSLAKSIFSPFAREVDPSLGGFAAAKLDTVTKQEALSYAAAANVKLRDYKTWRAMVKRSRFDEVVADLDEALAGVQGTMPGVAAPKASDSQIREIVAEVASRHNLYSEKARGQIRRIARLAREEGVSMADMENVLKRHLTEIVDDAQWAERFHVPSTIGTGDIAQVVGDKVKELQKQARFIAAEVEGLSDDIVGALARAGYKPVYGVDYFHPHQVLDIIPEIGEVARKHMRTKKLTSFFDRVEAPTMRAAKTKQLRSSLHAALTDAARKGRSIGMQVGQDGDQAIVGSLNVGAKISDGSADLDRIVDDLYDMVNEVGEQRARRLAASRNRRFTERVATYASMARTPFDPTALPSDLKIEEFMSMLKGRGYTEDAAKAIWRGLHQAKKIGFEYHGLYNLETHLRSNPNLFNGLRLLGKHTAGDGLRNQATSKALGWGTPLVAAGAAMADYNEENPDANNWQRAGVGLAGAAVGRAVGNAASRRLAGATPKVGNFLAKRENDLNWMRYANLTDHLASFRDMVRFSLSPIFDASRYSEAIILSQLDELPAGLRNLRVNQSPTSFRKELAREARATGKTAEEARQVAEGQWQKVLGEFQAASRGDFDWETIDGVGRRFASIGILGFSPTDWMSSTFGHLRRAGVDEAKAYEMVRDMYTYGTTHRSPAEMSMNFVFFPFSFTKKVLGHMTRAAQKDMSRLVMVHDGLATYQLLDEKYDLSEEFRDRLPILEKAYRLNVLAYGVGLGRFGGVNAPILETVRDLPGIGNAVYPFPEIDSITNVFIPQAMPVGTTEQANNLWDMGRQLIPVINDVNTLVGSAVSQGHVIASDTHLTREAEERRGWEEWRAYQDEIKPLLDQLDMTWSEARAKSDEFNALVNYKMTEISEKYGSWKFSIGDGLAHSKSIEMELNERIQYPKSAEDAQLIEFNAYFEALDEALRTKGAGFNSVLDVPPEAFDVMRRMAIDLATKNPRFLRLYNRFYRRILGEISTEMI